MTVAGGALFRAILSSTDAANANVEHCADAIDYIDEAFKALNKNTTIKFKWWHGGKPTTTSMTVTVTATSAVAGKDGGEE